MMRGHEKLMRNNTVSSAALNVVLNGTLVPKPGAVRTVIPTASSLAVMNLISAWIVYKKLHILSLPITKRRMLRGK